MKRTFYQWKSPFAPFGMWVTVVARCILVISLISGATADGNRFVANTEERGAIRKHLDTQHFNATPSLLHRKMCQTGSEECQEILVERKDVRRHAERELQRLIHNPRLGNIKVLVLLVQFTDHTDRTLIPKSTIEELWNGEIKEWFDVNAQGQYSVDPVVIDWRMTDNTESFYADGTSGFSGILQKAMWPILTELDNQPGWDWSPYDVDQDGRLDSVVMLHSGISALANDGDCGFDVPDMLDRIWPHATTSSIPPTIWQSEDESVSINGYTVNSVFDDGCATVPLTAGLTCHEYMHTMDLVDLYDGEDLLAAKGVGAWDVMGHPYGADQRGTPGLLSTWSKMAAEWITPTLITADGDYTVKAAHDNLDAYQIDITPEGSDKAEYFLIENRQPIGFETSLWGAGLLILHVDDAADGMMNRGYKGQDGWPQNGKHYQVAVVPKDGDYDLERNENFGDADDLFVPGDILGPGNQGGEIVYPNTDSYQNGVIVETGITIEVLSQDGTDITFRVSGIKQSTPGTTEPGGETPGIPAASPTADTASEPVADSPTPLPPTTQAPSILSSNTPAPQPTNNPLAESTPQPAAAPILLPTTTSPISPSSTGVPVPVGAPTNPPTDPPRWVLTRPPIITRAPFDFPEFPIQEPQEEVVADDVGSDLERNTSDVRRVTFGVVGRLLAALLVFVAM